MSATIHSHPTMRSRIALAALERMPRIASTGLGLDEDLCDGGWRLVLIWRVARLGSCVVMGRAVGRGRSLAEAERSLFEAVCRLPRASEAN